MSTDPRVDAYIERSAEFAKPILLHLRKLIHETCPQVEEKMKWSFPHFDYKGMFCSMAGFKAHCAFGFWKASLMKSAATLKTNQQQSMGHLGRITSLKNLPPDHTMINLLIEAMTLNELDIKLPSAPKVTVERNVEMHDMLKKELKKHKSASSAFDQLRPSHKNEYCEWINEAKTESTRLRRIEQTIALLKEGKNLRWKYEKK